MKLLYQTHSPYARKVLVAAHEMGLQESLTVVHYETSPTRRNEDVFALNPLGKVPVLICDNGTVLFDSNVICEYLDGLHAGPPLIPSQPEPHYRALKMQALAQGIADAGIAARWESERRPAELRWPSMHDGQVEKVAAACDFLERELGRLEAGDGESAGAAAVVAAGAGGADAVGRGAVRAGAVRAGAVRAGAVRAGAVGTGAVGTGAVSTVGARAVGAGALGARRPDIGDIALVTALSWVEFRRVYEFARGRPRLARWYAALCARPSMLATRLEGQTHD
jgi:glutathione S-transferase